MTTNNNVKENGCIVHVNVHISVVIAAGDCHRNEICKARGAMLMVYYQFCQ